MEVINKDVEMIAIFDGEGNIRPFRFKYQEQNETVVVNVNRLIHRKIEKIGKQTNIIFKCESVICGKKKIYEIIFDKDKLSWKLYKA